MRATKPAPAHTHVTLGAFTVGPNPTQIMTQIVQICVPLIIQIPHLFGPYLGLIWWVFMVATKIQGCPMNGLPVQISKNIPMLKTAY